MKKLMLIALLLMSALATSYAQAIIVGVRPIRPGIMIRPVCPGPGHVWVDGFYRWDRHLRRQVWVEGYWVRGPRHIRRAVRMRAF